MQINVRFFGIRFIGGDTDAFYLFFEEILFWGGIV